MNERTYRLGMGLVLWVLAASGGAIAEPTTAMPTPGFVAEAAISAATPKGVATPGDVEAPLNPSPANPVALALRGKIAALPSQGTDEELREYTALAAFYTARVDAPVWIAAHGGWTPEAEAALAEIKNADAWGLEAAAFSLPTFDPTPETKSGPKAGAVDAATTPEAQATRELDLTLAILKYARFARGGRIIYPGGQLNSNLDRRPQFIDPKAALDEIAAAADSASYLRNLHPPHPQFERLRQTYLAWRAAGKTADAKRVLANMEQWRWMWRDMGDLYLLANIPEYMLHVVKDGTMISTERIVVGEVGKQTAIFSRRLKHIVLRPKWRVPESIKVLELQPSLRRGGGMFVKYGLQLETKDGRPLDYRTIDWTTADIRDYEVTQPPGKRSALGKVKFSFPSQHTIYMHDTPDKYMFNAGQRTLSHGCLRLRNPMRLVEMLLAEDKGWDAARIKDLSDNGPLNNEVPIERKIPLHITYFTVWVGDDGSVRTYRDVYGHEKRITLALDGKWDQIAKGRDHLAPVTAPAPRDPDQPALVSRAKKPKDRTPGDFMSNALGGIF